MNEFLRKYSVNRNFFGVRLLLLFFTSWSLRPLLLSFNRYNITCIKEKASPRANHSSIMSCSSNSDQIRVEERVDELPPSFVAVAVRGGCLLAKYVQSTLSLLWAVISTLVIDSQMNHSLVKTHPAHNYEKMKTVKQLPIAKHNGPHNIY